MWRVWLLASRPHTLTASIAPVLVGHTCAATSIITPGNTSLLRTTTISWLLFCLLIQLGTNLHNDYADFVMGADTCKRVGQARATQKGWLSPQQTCAGSTLTLTLALAIGLQVIFEHTMMDPVLWFIILSSIFNAVAYTGGPFPLGYIGMSNVSIAYSGLGDVFCFVYFGLVATLVIPYLSAYTGEFITSCQELKPFFGPSLQVGFLATAIIVVNNLRDRHTDVDANKRTVAVRFGGTFCRVEYTLLIVLSFAIVVNQYIQSNSNSRRLLPLLSLPLAVTEIKSIWIKDGADLNPHVGGTARLQLAFCILLSFGMML
jgi:1,4-dihydroxy-2-naphthoate octaprenyltransferase